jgi:hypothetical protein
MLWRGTTWLSQGQLASDLQAATFKSLRITGLIFSPFNQEGFSIFPFQLLLSQFEQIYGEGRGRPERDSINLTKRKEQITATKGLYSTDIPCSSFSLSQPKGCTNSETVHIHHLQLLTWHRVTRISPKYMDYNSYIIENARCPPLQNTTAQCCLGIIHCLLRKSYKEHE